MALDRLQNVGAVSEDDLRRFFAPMDPRQIQAFAAQNKNKPEYGARMVLVAGEVAALKNQMRQAMQAQQMGQQGEPPKIADQAIANMAPQQQQLPEDQGIATLPAENMQNMAYGGIAGYADGGFPQDIYSGDPEYGGPGMAGGGMVERYQAGGQPPSNAFDNAFNFVLGVEGDAYVPDDAGKGPSKYGILQSANPGVGDVKDLTKDRAREIYKNKYWDQINGDALAAKDPRLAAVVFDTAVNHGVGTAKNMLSRSGGDPDKILGQRRDLYTSLIQKNPNVFSQYATGWENRLNKLAGISMPASQPAAPQATPQAAPDKAARLEELGKRVDETRAALKAGPMVGTEAEFGMSSAATEENARLRADADNALKQYQAYASELGIDKPAVPKFTKRRFVPAEVNPYVADVAQKAAAPDIVAQEERTQARAEEDAKKAAQKPTEDEEKRREAYRAFRVSEIQEQNRLGELEKNLTKKQKEKVGKTAEDLHPNAGKKGWTKDDWILLGLGLMASKNRQFLGALGEAGMGVMAERRAQKKEERDELYRRAVTAKELALAGYYGTGGGRKSPFSGLLAAVDKADTLASKRADASWNDMQERQELIKKGFKSRDEYFDALRKRERLNRLQYAVQGAAPVDEEDTDEET